MPDHIIEASNLVTAENIAGKPAQVVLDLLGSNKISGLSFKQAAERLAHDGPNELKKKNSLNALSVLLAQFKSSVVILLLFAAAISFFMKEYLQTAGIMVAIVINASIGFLTEYRSKLSLENLAKLAGAAVRVRRENRELNLPVSELVRGDIVLLEHGTRVPADLCLIESAAFSADESTLTGESLPVWKEAITATNNSAHLSVAYQGTIVLSGRAIAVVIATGDKTQLGKLGRVLDEASSGETPLTKSLDVLGHQLTMLVAILCIIFAALGIVRHLPIEQMIETSIALAVAVIPEGLPVVATLALAAGIRRMVRAKALVRHLTAVETLGCTTIICTDKTGTLTENKMLVTDIVLNQQHLNLSGSGYAPMGVLTNKNGANEINRQVAEELFTAACLCNDARLETHAGTNEWHIHGDPTEGALITAALKLDLNDKDLRMIYPRLTEVPFDLSRQRMSTLHKEKNDGHILFVKGSPERVLPLCTELKTNIGSQEITAEQQKWFEEQNILLAKQGLRVLALAQRKIQELPKDTRELENDLTLLGLVGMSDQPKENIDKVLQQCQSAGIRIIMLTGDQPATAQAIAKTLGITPADLEYPAVYIGNELEKFSQQEFSNALTTASVLARVTPEMKLAIVQHLQKLGQIVAMTGDGVNDAPALKQANIGIAMGQAGADLAWEASDLVITDDNFATIVKAIEQGRIIYANISRAVGFLLTGSLTSVLAVTLGLFVSSSLFLEPLKLLYLNLIMHVFPGLGIVLQKEAGDVMTRPPRKQTDKLLGTESQFQIITRSIFIALATLAASIIDQQYFGNKGGTTLVLTTLSSSLILQSWSWLAIEQHSPNTAWHLNKPMLVCTAIDLVLLAVAVYNPVLQTALNTNALSPEQLLLVSGIALGTYFLSTAIDRLFLFFVLLFKIKRS